MARMAAWVSQRPVHRVARGDGDARLRKQRGEFLRHALHAGAAGDQAAFGAALRAFGRRRGFIAALMTGKPLAIAMLDQPGRTVAARHLVAAGFAQRQRRIAAAVEEQHRLLAGGQRDGERLAQGLRQPGAGFAPSRGADRSAGSAASPPRRGGAPASDACSARRGIDIGLQRRRGAGEHDGAMLQPRRAPPPCRARDR